MALTRGALAAIYNAAVEAGYTLGSPANTEWASPTDNFGIEVRASRREAVDSPISARRQAPRPSPFRRWPAAGTRSSRPS